MANEFDYSQEKLAEELKKYQEWTMQEFNKRVA
ncbi:hypothetical protein SAMN05720781_3090 [Fibrobacter sp. UWT3]|nr:hypothetical protein SAMN05720781_3090 [Fibrobacter sp. UWT3]